MPTLDSQSRIRWWPAAIILALTILAIILLWIIDAPHRQSRVLHTIMVLMLSFPLMLLWLLFFSRLRWKVRLLAFGAIVLILLLSTTLLRVKGFSGDLMPLLEWRWGGKDYPLPPLACGGIRGGAGLPAISGTTSQWDRSGNRVGAGLEEVSTAAAMAATHRRRLVGVRCGWKFGNHPRTARRI